MTDTKTELKDDDLNTVTGGNEKGYSLVNRDIIAMFTEAFTNNNFVMTKELANNCKQQVLGAMYAYKNLGYLDDVEYKELSDILEGEYQMWLERCTL